MKTQSSSRKEFMLLAPGVQQALDEERAYASWPDEPIVGPLCGGSEDAEPAFSARLCTIIVEYWRQHGHRVSAWVESEIASAGRIYVIRTSGIPVRSC